MPQAEKNLPESLMKAVPPLEKHASKFTDVHGKQSLISKTLQEYSIQS